MLRSGPWQWETQGIRRQGRSSGSTLLGASAVVMPFAGSACWGSDPRSRRRYLGYPTDSRTALRRSRRSESSRSLVRAPRHRVRENARAASEAQSIHLRPSGSVCGDFGRRHDRQLADCGAISPGDLQRIDHGGPTLLGDPKTDPAKPAFSVDKVAARQRELHPFNPRLRELHQKVLFTSFHVGGGPGQSWHTVLFNNLPKSTNAETRLVDAVVSSGAMPGQLGSWKGHIDGAFVNHDPTLAAIALAVNEGVALQDITAICFGTGFMANWIRSDTHAWGAQQWQNGDDNPADNTPPLLVNGTDSPILNAMLNGTSTNLTPQLCGMMLGDRYAYLNPVLDRYIAEDDTNPNDLAYLESQSAKVDISQASSVVDKYWY